MLTVAAAAAEAKRLLRKVQKNDGQNAANWQKQCGVRERESERENERERQSIELISEIPTNIGI